MQATRCRHVPCLVTRGVRWGGAHGARRPRCWSGAGARGAYGGAGWRGGVPVYGGAGWRGGGGGVPSGRKTCRASPSKVAVQWPSWRRWWWWPHTWRRFWCAVSPPWSQWMTWCRWHQARGRSHPGKRQPRSRAARARRRCGGTTRVVRPTSVRRLWGPSTTRVMAASQARRMATAGAMGPWYSRSQTPPLRAGQAPVSLWPVLVGW